MKSILIFSLIIGPSAGMGQNADKSPLALPLNTLVPEVTSLDIEAVGVAADGDPVTLPSSLDQIAEDHALAASTAPKWVKKLRSKTLMEYFPADLDDTKPAWSQGAQDLLADAKNLHDYYEQNDRSGLYKDFVEKKLSPFVQHIDAKKLTSAMRDKKITRPLGEWTVETLVVTEQVAYIGKYPNFVKNTLGLLTGRHLRGASAVAGVIVIGGAVTYVLHWFGISDFAAGAMMGGAMGSALAGAFQAGPLAAILNAATGWFIQPTTEIIKVISSRYTGPLEQKINNVYDSWKPKDIDPTKNAAPNIPTVEGDGTDFAGMSPDEQKQNWKKNLRMWVAVSKTFGQLLRDTHHSGRFLMMISWADEQLATNLVETMDTKLTNLSVEAETVLTPYKSGILANAGLNADDRLSALAQLESNFDLYQKLNESKWLDADLDSAAIAEINSQIEAVREELAKAGMSSRDIHKLEALQIQRERAVSTIITTLTVNELRSFNAAEANRNLEPEARKAQRAIRNGFHLQDYVNQYRVHVQQMMERMGYKNSRKPLPGSPQPILSCSQVFF